MPLIELSRCNKGRRLSAINKKKVIWIVSVISSCVFIFTLWAVSSYEESEKFNGFPIPKYAEVTKSRDGFESYSGKAFSETKKDGLPFIYRLHIKAGGWEKSFQEGALITYEKDNQKIDVIAETNYLSIGINKD